MLSDHRADFGDLILIDLSRSAKVTLLVLLVLVLDQALKFWVKTNMTLGQEIPILGLSWAKIHFVENNGMAFGLELPEPWGKLALSLFRIAAVSVLIYWIRSLIKAKASFGFVCSIALILAGAIGNILDSAFYGLIFSNSYYEKVAEFLPEGGGYASFLFGRVVDMFYFPMVEGQFPEWFPIWSGQDFKFFRPVFNLADTAITTGVLSILIFHRDSFGNMDNPEAENTSEATSETATEITTETSTLSPAATETTQPPADSSEAIANAEQSSGVAEEQAPPVTNEEDPTEEQNKPG
ncbi:MAG: lipoprotein signal peptidase [Bacteroidota bacterium]